MNSIVNGVIAVGEIMNDCAFVISKYSSSMTSTNEKKRKYSERSRERDTFDATLRVAHDHQTNDVC